MIELLGDYKDRSFVGVAELAKAARKVLESSGIRQSRDKMVAEFPNERTIRFYQSQRLLPQAAREGTASIFFYEHLLTLIVIKRLQSIGVPIRTIGKILAGRDISRLEQLLTEEVRASSDPEEGRLARLRGEEVLDISDLDEWRDIGAAPVQGSVALSSESQSWERFPVSQGIELHLAPDSGLDNNAKQSLIQKLASWLRSNSSS